MTILQDIYKLSPSNLITLYELDLSPCIGRYGATTSDVYKWCDGVNELGNDIVWGGVTYTRYPIQATGFDKQGNGSIPRPKLIAGNYGGIIGDLARDYNDIVGAKLKRIRTFARYLDPVNFKAKNYFKKSNDISAAGWTRTNITAALDSSILPFAVGSKISITGTIPTSYNLPNLVVTASTANTVTVASTNIEVLTQAGIITGSGYTTNMTAISTTGTTVTFTFTAILTAPPVPNEPIYGITETATSGGHYLSQTVTYTAGKTYCMSIYVRPNLRTRFRIYFPGAMFTDTNARIAYFDLKNKSFYSTNNATLNPTIEPVDGFPGWYRCSISEVAEVTVSAAIVAMYLTSTGTTTSYVGDTTQTAMLVCAPQITEGSKYPVEYYPESNATINTNPYADSNQYLDKEVWTVDRKSNENSAFVEWELTAPYDLIGVKIPRRQCIQNVCPWKYRGTECGYTGTSYFNIKDEPVGTAAADICGKRVSSCKLRFPGGQAMPYGGFPAIGI